MNNHRSMKPVDVAGLGSKRPATLNFGIGTSPDRVRAMGIGTSPDRLRCGDTSIESGDDREGIGTSPGSEKRKPSAEGEGIGTSPRQNKNRFVDGAGIVKDGIGTSP